MSASGNRGAVQPTLNTDDRILELLAQSAPMSAAQIATALGLGETSALTSLRRLRERGLARVSSTRTPHGEGEAWELPASGTSPTPTGKAPQLAK